MHHSVYAWKHSLTPFRSSPTRRAAASCKRCGMVNSRSMTLWPEQAFTNPVCRGTGVSSTKRASWHCGQTDSGGSTLFGLGLSANLTRGWPNTANSGKHASTAWETPSKRNARNRKPLNRSKAHERENSKCDESRSQVENRHRTDVQGLG